MRKLFIITIFLLTFSVFANAQAQMVYHHLEVVDSNQKRIEDAKVEMNTYQNSHDTLQINPQGTYSIGIMYPNGWSPLSSVFAISKPGYFLFEDFGLPLISYGSYSIKIELFKIPINKQERQALGNEQLKREFITAVQKGDTEAVRKFLKLRINPNLTIRDLRGITTEPKTANISALQFSIIRGHGAVVKLLLENGATIPKPSKTTNSRIEGMSASNVLYYYLTADYISRTYSIKDEKGREKLLEIIEQERNEGLKALIKAGAKINERYFYYSPLYREDATILMFALDKNYIGAAKILIENGVDVTAKDKQGYTALIIAKNKVSQYREPRLASTRLKFEEIVKLLEAAGAKE